MSTFRQPQYRVPFRRSDGPGVDHVGVTVLRCRVRLHLEPSGGRPPLPHWFVMDSGASYSQISLAQAERFGLPVPPAEREIEQSHLTARGWARVRVRPGRLRAWWGPTPEGYPFDWPILFVVDAPPTTPAVIGLTGVIATCDWTFSGRYTPDAPYGALTLEDTR